MRVVFMTRGLAMPGTGGHPGHVQSFKGANRGGALSAKASPARGRAPGGQVRSCACPTNALCHPASADISRWPPTSLTEQRWARVHRRPARAQEPAGAQKQGDDPLGVAGTARRGCLWLRAARPVRRLHFGTLRPSARFLAPDLCPAAVGGALRCS